MNRLVTLWMAVRDSLWFIPAVMVCGSIALAVTLIELQALADAGLGEAWPRLFGSGAEGARGVLSAIATSMMTVAGVVFSITIVALSLAASQYSPRVLQNFMSDRPTQVVLGAFVSVFSYCLIVLRTIRGGDDGGFVPSVAVLGGVVLALGAVALLIYFIHHLALEIQVSSIVGRICKETEAAIDLMFPADVGRPPESAEETTGAAAPPASLQGQACTVKAQHSGYLVSVDGDGLLASAKRLDRLIQVLPRVGDYVLHGEPLCKVFAQGKQAQADDDAEGNFDDLCECFALQPERTVHQDVAHGLQQLVDVALKALSPSVHDPRTAIACIHRLGHLLALLAGRAMPASERLVDGRLRLVVPTIEFGALLGTAFDPLVRNMGSHLEVGAEVVQMQSRIGRFAKDDGRKAALRQQLDTVSRAVDAAELQEHDRNALRARIVDAHRCLVL